MKWPSFLRRTGVGSQKTLGRPYFVIFAAMRTGSNYLERAINQYDDLNCLGELFNPAFIGAEDVKEKAGFTVADRNKHPFRFLKAVQDQTEPQRMGFRIFAGHNDAVTRFVAQDPMCAKVVLTRNPLDSFVSLRIARKTKQWLVTDEKSRRGAKIEFDKDMYAAYLEKLNSFYAEVDAAVHEAGQTAFRFHYDALKDTRIVNGLARHVGASKPRERIEEMLKKQNPGGLRDKVENYDQMMRDLATMVGPGEVASEPEPAETATGAMIALRHKPLVFAPIHGAAVSDVAYLLDRLDEPDAEPLPPHALMPAIGEGARLMSRTRLKEISAQLDSGALCFTFVSHPVARAYGVFIDKIFRTIPGSFQIIRTRLREQFGLIMPEHDEIERAAREGWDTLAGYDLAAHRAAFKTFLRFVEQNLADKTDIRKDGVWRPQWQMLSSLRARRQLGFVGRAEALERDMTYLAQRAGFDAATGEMLLDMAGLAERRTADPFGLDQIYDDEIEDIAEQIYKADYRKLGYQSYAQLAGLELTPA